MGLLKELEQGLQKAAQLLKTDIRDLFKAEGRLVDEAFLNELLDMFIKADMGVEAARVIVDEIGNSFRGRVIKLDDVLERVKKTLGS